ncbi:hypothetical protein [Paenibacillus alba]|uniref:Uncharacterized protein n=1 Tax=Paenibacillus alba TaxID=1197127 RepID=A0ABU6FY07_9BACL|nr:hypothetical protein [Paenibacillus alba]MEC0226762.1 hypothetical protein [Paenibacillus alba]
MRKIDWVPRPEFTLDLSLKIAHIVKLNFGETHKAWEKKIVTRDGIIHAWSMAYACKNQDCAHAGVAYKSAEAEMLSMKHSSFLCYSNSKLDYSIKMYTNPYIEETYRSKLFAASGTSSFTLSFGSGGAHRCCRSGA